jgi:hypothetical protein
MSVVCLVLVVKVVAPLLFHNLEQSLYEMHGYFRTDLVVSE